MFVDHTIFEQSYKLYNKTISALSLVLQTQEVGYAHFVENYFAHDTSTHGSSWGELIIYYRFPHTQCDSISATRLIERRLLPPSVLTIVDLVCPRLMVTEEQMHYSRYAF